MEREAARMRMRLLPVGAGGERVAAVNRGLGIVPLEMLGQGDAGSLAEVYHVFRALDLADAGGDGEAQLAHAFAIWGEALARAGIRLMQERSALYGAPLPRTEWRANAGGIALRPPDVELTALAAGLRRIVKLDRIPFDLVESLRHEALRRGLRVAVVAPEGPTPEAPDPAGSVTLLLVRDASVLDEARALEALLLASGGAPEARAATLRMGELLGYPRCCAERFTRVAEQNDTTLAWALLPGVPHVPAPPATQWLQPGLALLSHAPCDLHCAASIALGERLTAALDGLQPGFAERWRSLTARLQVVDHCGVRLALGADGRLEAGATITVVDLLAAGGSDPDAVGRAQRLVGRTVIPDSGGVVVVGGGWYAPYVADHRR